MKYILYNVLIMCSLMVLAGVSQLAYAQTDAVPVNSGSNVSQSGSNGNVSQSGSNGNVSPAGRSGSESATLTNPLQSTSLLGLMNSILDVIMVFAVPLIVFFIIFAGFKYVMSQGNPGGIEQASKALLYAIIGGLIILGAKIILEVISGTIAAF